MEKKRRPAKAARSKPPARRKAAAPKPLAFASVESLYAHALAIEEESVRRYGELSGRMSLQGEETLSGLFGLLARFEQGHAALIKAHTKTMKLPAVDPQQHAWVQGHAGNGSSRAGRLTPRVALETALKAEKTAKAFYESVATRTRNRAIRELARDMAGEEQLHMETIEYALERLPK